MSSNNRVEDERSKYKGTTSGAQVDCDLESPFELSTEQGQELMTARASKWAKVEEQKQEKGDLEVAVFALGKENYAIESRYIREIMPSSGCTRVPHAPDFVAGIINVHGQIVPLIDLQKFFCLPRDNDDTFFKIIVLGQDRIEFAITANAVDRIQTLNKSDLMELPDGISACRDHTLGVTLDALTVLDGGSLIAEKRLFVNSGSDLKSI